MTEENQEFTLTAQIEASPKKVARKRATKKAAKKATKKAARKGSTEPEAAKESPLQDSVQDSPPQQASPREDAAAEEVTFRGGIVVDDSEQAQPATRLSQDGGMPERKESHPQNGGQGQGQGHDRYKGNKFKNKNKRGKPRGKNKWRDRNNKREREEASTIELGELFEWDVLENLDELAALSLGLKSEAGEPVDFNRIYAMGLTELRGEAAALEVEMKQHAPNREQLIHALLKQEAARKHEILATGVLELFEDDAGGILVYERDSYRIRPLCAFVPQVFIDYYGLQRGHIVKAQLHPNREGESCPFVVRIDRVMDRDPESLTEIVPFTERVPYYPTSRILMETLSEAKWDNLSMRVVDCLTPVGFGQRGLIVAPPRTGKTILLQGMANAIQRNYPEAHLIILLIDERPEEVTDFRRQVQGEVISSTFDESAESHVHAAEMVIEKARRMVEVGKDVVILLDSITRLARAYNTTMPSSGKILSGGVEANALQKPKRFFGSARNIEDGGSLTIMATALVETGSKMDEVIFEEFKGTGNMELHLDRGLSDKRIFPALSIDKSGTRKEELLYHPDEMQKIYSLRRAMKGLPSTDAMEMLIQRIKKTNTNAEFLMSVGR